VVKEGVNSGNQGEGVNSFTRHLEVEVGWRGVAERDDGVAGIGRPRWKMELTVGARLAVTEGEGVVVGLHKLEEETSFVKYANAAQAGMGRECARGVREKRGRGRWLAGLRGRAGRLVAGPIVPNATENSFPNRI
jgi:hypothetical protein